MIQVFGTWKRRAVLTNTYKYGSGFGTRKRVEARRTLMRGPVKAVSALNSLDVEEAAGVGLKASKKFIIRNWICNG